MARVLIIEAERDSAHAVASLVEQAGHDVESVRTGSEGVASITRDHPDLVLLGLPLPDASAVEVLERTRGDRAVVIVLAASGEEAMAAEAMRAGAESVLAKPVAPALLGAAAARALEKVKLREMNRFLASKGERLDATALLGSSPAMRELVEQIELLARSDRTTVLLVGETGTGKGRVAATIHRRSPRAHEPFVEVNCAAFTPAELDVELFGQDASSDNASAHRTGRIELAAGGSLFLAEIADLDAHLQPKLLRILEGKGFRRAGGTREVTSDARLIAATTKDLVTEVTASRFREDLYYRLSVMPINLPPLRARARDDLVELVGHLVGALAPDLPDAPTSLDDAALDRLLRYSWPGNIREMRNVLERAMIIARGQSTIRPEHLPVEVREVSGAGVEHHVPRSLAEVERAHIERTLQHHNANRTRAAKELGISRATLIKKIKEYGLNGR